jgi:hypothetical protein
MSLGRFLLVMTLALVLVLGSVIWFFPSNEDFCADNPFWNGIGNTMAGKRLAPLDSLAELLTLPLPAALVLVPYQRLRADEMKSLQDFTIRGGTLFIADDYGYGNQVLEYFGLGARFSGQPLLDPWQNYKNAWFPRIEQLKSHPLAENVDSLVLNHATGLTNVRDVEVLATSSPFSFLDLNGNQNSDADEPVGPLPVISQHRLGKGQMVLIADPSIFINSMQDLGDNGVYIENIAAASGGLYIDQSHLPPSNLHHAKSLLSGIRNILSAPSVSILVVLSLLILVMLPLWYGRAAVFRRT